MAPIGKSDDHSISNEAFCACQNANQRSACHLVDMEWKSNTSHNNVGLRKRKNREEVEKKFERRGWENDELFYESHDCDVDTDDEPPCHDDVSCTDSSSCAQSNEADSIPLVIGKRENDSETHLPPTASFLSFRLQYLIVHIAIMLADGMQGTHLYVLYEGYGYSVASLYCLGFVSGALTSPFIGPVVDKIGRKKSAVVYCILEIAINLLEQYDVLAGLIVSRVVGGITTNLLFSVFEAWLVTEHRRRGFTDEKLETVMRDSVVSSNLSAIASGYFAHILATQLGPVGPFEGAVACTFVAFLLVCTKWEENYGSTGGVKTVRAYMKEAFAIIISDSKIYKIGIIQGLSDGTLQTFVFLWSPALRYFTTKIPRGTQSFLLWGLDTNGEPAYGLIFGAFMACGVLGGMLEPSFRRVLSSLMTTSPRIQYKSDDCTLGDEKAYQPAAACKSDRPVGVELLAAMAYMISAILLATPLFVDHESPYAFAVTLGAFLLYEFMIGLYMPCEGVIRSIYMPNDSICSLMTMLRIIINVLVALGVFSTNYMSFTSAFAAGSVSLSIAAGLQLSLIDKKQWSNLTKNTVLLTASEMAQKLDDSSIPPLLCDSSPNMSISSCVSCEISSGDESDLDISSLSIQPLLKG